MATVSDATGKIDVVIDRSRGQIRGEDKPVIRIHGGMLLQSVTGNVVLEPPVRIQIARKFKEIPILVPLPSRAPLFSFCFLISSALMG